MARPRAVTPLSISSVPPAPPAAPAEPEEAPPAPPAAPGRKRKPKRRRSWTVMLVPPTGGSVRSYEVRIWQLRLAATFSAFLLIGSLIGGTILGGIWREEEIADMDALLWDTQLSVAALSDTLQAVRMAATITGATPASAGRPTAVASRGVRTSRVALRQPDPGVVLPVFGRISSGFSRGRVHPILRIRRPHLGLDVAAPSGTRIRAPAAGRVSRVDREFGFGLIVEIDHGNGVMSRYGHLRAALVSAGEHVEAGAEIATVGSSGLATGPHLHYEVLVNRRHVDPLHYVITGTPDPNAAGAAGTPGVAATPAGPPGAPAPGNAGTAAGHTTNAP